MSHIHHLLVVGLALALLSAGCAHETQRAEAKAGAAEPLTEPSDVEEASSDEESTDEKPVADDEAKPADDGAEPAIGPLGESDMVFVFLMPSPEPTPNASPKCKAARKDFEEGLILQDLAFAVPSEASSRDELQKLVNEKMKLLRQAEEKLRQSIKHRCARWATASADHIGLGLAHFAEFLLEASVPQKLSDDQKETYCRLIFEQAESAFENATGQWKHALKLAKQTGEDNVWTREAAEYLEAGGLDEEAEVEICMARRR